MIPMSDYQRPLRHRSCAQLCSNLDNILKKATSHKLLPNSGLKERARRASCVAVCFVLTYLSILFLAAAFIR